LKWARESCGTSVEDAAEKIGLSPTAFAHFEKEESKVRLTDLRKLAHYFRRPLTAFLLSEPPSEPLPPPDFRMLPGRHHPFERQTHFAIRRASRLRSVARDMMESLGRETSPRLDRAKLSQNPIEVAQRERKSFGVSTSDQFEWKNEWQAYRVWRSVVEQRNVLVFQFPIPVEDARGFSLSDEEPFAIALSASDAPRGRIFTLLHEYAHLLLRTPGVCLPGREPHSKSSTASIERWCDKFAAEFLVPGLDLSSLVKLHSLTLDSDLTEALVTGSRAFKVSELVVLGKLLDERFISRRDFFSELRRLKNRPLRPKKGGGASSTPERVLRENGHLFTSIVLEARGRNFLSYADVADYLSMNLDYLAGVESSLSKAAA
jgi:Zn-dependent peptidase ImmA (M78 family)/transcriptional regulator with XRE-family HTH domain